MVNEGGGPWKLNQISLDKWELMNKDAEAEPETYKREGVIKKLTFSAILDPVLKCFMCINSLKPHNNPIR